MRSLSWKLAGAFLLIAIVSIGLMAYLTNLSTTREFKQYVVQGNMMYAQGVGTSLSSYYSSQHGWNGVQNILPSLLRISGDRLIIADVSGKIVGDTDGSAIGQTVAALGLAGYGTPVLASGQPVGSFYYLTYGSTGWGMMGGWGNGMMGDGMMGGSQTVPVTVNNPEARFLGEVNRSLWIAALAAIALALAVGFVLTRQITRPLRELTRGARQISKGDLNYRVKSSSRDELGELVESFNTMAVSLNESEQFRKRMTADIAHELRTPLTIIEGTVDGMLDGIFQPDREHLTSVKEQTALLTRLIGDLRELSLAESGQLKLALAADNIVELVRHKVEQIEVTARAKGLQVKFSADSSVPEMNIDRVRIEQVVANLLTNAIHHTPSGGTITVSVKPVDAAGAGPGNGAVLLSVSDTGEGITAGHLQHIFERFYRVSDSRARSEGGTGLGLAIVKHLVQAHGGKVWAESEPGRGSRFFVLLPLTP